VRIWEQGRRTARLPGYDEFEGISSCGIQFTAFPKHPPMEATARTTPATGCTYSRRQPGNHPAFQNDTGTLVTFLADQ